MLDSGRGTAPVEFSAEESSGCSSRLRTGPIHQTGVLTGKHCLQYAPTDRRGDSAPVILSLRVLQLRENDKPRIIGRREANK